MPTQTQETACFRPAERIATLGVSEILAIGARAAELRAMGRDIITLGAGEPDFDTPDPIKKAAWEAMQRGETKYTPLTGTPALKEAIIRKFQRENGLDYRPSEIIACAGAKQVIYNAMMATLNPGDEVIIPTPYWVTYSDIVELCGAVPVLVPCSADQGFRLTAAQLKAAITPKTRWLMLNSPSNPSGAAYAEAHLRPLLEVLLAAPHVWLMVDDMYEHIVYDGFRHVTAAAVEPRIKERTLTINGVSKAYAMTGWRLGYAGGPEALIQGMSVIQSQSTSGASSISQAAAIAALDGPQGFLADRAEAFRQRRDTVVAALNAVPGLSCRSPEGAFYAFPECKGLIGRRRPEGQALRSDRDVCAWLMEAAGVAVVPGSAFGLPGHFRVSYATSTATLNAALTRIHEACETLEAVG
ncbi:pyridoxal phosphate-dependent aminotransferase [Salipiger abyssi]|uniref:pyridoxal phosphate-dependent aminotransferase n=1 Tax=Salipiger abyssi TaxID=1250539 RepID=UPI001A8F67A9|nr:pyridoxal phosphate-dependent aminotransferase [Salipiger abyssi]MBN9886930.1 pyridoxal phosphate-dependent aminotransferase [Salipiger abyssi]